MLPWTSRMMMKWTAAQPPSPGLKQESPSRAPRTPPPEGRGASLPPRRGAPVHLQHRSPPRTAQGVACCPSLPRGPQRGSTEKLQPEPGGSLPEPPPEARPLQATPAAESMQCCSSLVGGQHHPPPSCRVSPHPHPRSTPLWQATLRVLVKIISPTQSPERAGEEAHPPAFPSVGKRSHRRHLPT